MAGFIIEYAVRAGVLTHAQHVDMKQEWMLGVAAELLGEMAPADRADIALDPIDRAVVESTIHDGQRHEQELREHGLPATDKTHYLAALHGLETAEALLKAPGNVLADRVLRAPVPTYLRDKTVNQILFWVFATVAGVFSSIPTNQRADLLKQIQRNALTGTPTRRG